jgi:repressor LexA
VFAKGNPDGGRQVTDAKLTDRQREVVDFIRGYARQHGYPPAVRDIGRALGLASPSTVHGHLAKLERAGLLRRDPTKPRALELLGGSAWAAAAAAGLPLVGRVAAGQPVLAEENIEDYIEVPELAGGERGEFVLRVSGDSMREAGILEGDYVIVQRRETADDGEIVVALVEDEATVKRFYRERDHVRLEPENPEMEPIRAREVMILGRVVGVCRRVA